MKIISLLIIHLSIFLFIGCNNNSIVINVKEQQILSSLKNNIKDSIAFKLTMDSICKYYNSNDLLLSEAYFLNSKHYSTTNIDSAKNYLEKAIEISRKNNIDTLTIDMFLYKEKLTSDFKLSKIDLTIADSLARLHNDTLRTAKVNQTLGRVYYSQNPKECEKYFEIGYKNFILIKDTTNAGYCIQNIGFAYGEQLNDFANAIKYIERAHSLWLENKNIFQQANLEKYLGFAYSKLNNFQKAKSFIFSGIDKFYLIKDTSGVNVCFYDLSLIYENEKKLDSAIFYQEKAKEYWNRSKNIYRIFGINNNLFLNYLKTNKRQKADMCYKENVGFINEHENEMSWIMKLYFYNNCISYFTVLNDKDSTSIYKDKLSKFKEELTKNGIAIPTGI